MRGCGSGTSISGRKTAWCCIGIRWCSSGGVEASKSQCEVLLSSALDACERYYPAFQFVVWAGEGAREAMEAAMFETAGQA